jgi:hypothetical protein
VINNSSTLYLHPTIPPQKISQADKTESWGKKCVDSIVMMGNQTMYNGRNSTYRKQVNYDLVNSVFDEEDFEYVLNPYNLPKTYGNQPSKLQDFNIIRAKIELLKGEELKRPFSYMAVGVAGEVVSAVATKKKELVLQILEKQLMAALGKGEVDQEGNPVRPPEVETELRKFNKNYQDIREQVVNQILKYGERKENFQAKFNKGWEHALIAAEEIYYVGIVGDEPCIRVVNPLNFDYDKNPDLENIEDAQWAREYRYMSVGQILDEYGEFLSEDEVDRIDKGLVGPSNGSYGPMMAADWAFDASKIKGYVNGSQLNDQMSHILVTTCVWRSMRKIGFVTYFDEQGEKQETIVDDTFKLSSEMKAAGYSVEWQWINEVWKGTRIGGDIYVDIAPLPNQNRSIDNPSLCKLPYVGRVYNNLNSKATSLVDLAKPHQYTYITVWYRLMNELAKAKGKKMVFDIAAIPKSQGIDTDKWIYYFDNLGIAFINSFEEGTEGSSTGQLAVSKFNQYTAIDMSLSQVVQQYMMIIDKLEDMVGELCGVSRQRQGQVATNETVGGVERSVIQSSMVTESLFFYHNEVKRQVLTQYVEAAKIAYMNGKKAQFIADDMMRVMLEIDGEDLNDSDFAVFVSNSTKDNQVIEKLNGLAQIALQSDKARLSDLITIFKSNSISEIEHTIKQGEQEAIDRQSQQAESQNQSMLQNMQLQNENAERQRMWESEEHALDRENKVQVAEISAMGFAVDKDVDNNGVPDVLEIAKLASKEVIEKQKLTVKGRELEIKKQLEDKKLNQAKKMQEEETKLRREEMRSKEKIAKSKPKPKK